MPFDSEKTAGAYRIISGDEPRRHVRQPDIQRFATILAESIHDTPPIYFPEIREGIRAVLNGPAVALTNRELPIDRLYPYPSDTEAKINIARDIAKMRRDRTLSAILAGRKLVGIGGFMDVRDTKEENGGRPLIEIRRIAIDEEHRKRRTGIEIFPELADTILRGAEEQKPSALLLATRRPSVIRWTLERGFSEIDWERFYKQHKKVPFSRYQHTSFADRVKRGEWRYFERDAQTG